jgi:sugar/nucleoside kinase (ribokinase family)
MPEVLVVGPIVVEQVATGDGGWRRQLGGSGLTAALASGAHGAETALAGWVGADDAEEALALLQRAGVDSAALAVVPGASATFVVHDPSDGAAPAPQYRPSETSPQTLPRPSVRWANVTLVFGSPDVDPIARGWLDSSDNETVIWDRQGWLSRARDSQLVALLPARRRIWLGNLDEARAEAGVDTAAAALDALPPTHFDLAIVKCGPWGVVVRAHEGEETHLGAYATSGPSAIGTGDAFAGALAAKVARGESPEVAARWACAIAAAFLAQRSNVVDESVIDRAGELSRTSSLFVDRREVERLTYDIGLSHGPAGDLLTSVIAARLRHLGLMAATEVEKPDLYATDRRSADGSECVVLSFADGSDEAQMSVRTLDELTAGVVRVMRDRYGRRT